MIRKQTKLWTTKDGTKLRLCDMTDDHLVNAIRYLKRYASAKYEDELYICACAEASFQGDMAKREAENAMDSLSPEEFLPALYYDMKLEAQRRGLKRKTKES